MRNLKQNGSALVALIMVIAVILILVFGYQYSRKDGQKNQIQSGQDAIDQAKGAADAQNQNTLYLQNELQDSPSVNYHGIQNNLKNIRQ
ncbi:MAG: hypothetical protein KW802_00210 [Candidatus Doudnabacteria bacterium]|nr:hypothetical protein [Candidatus Doudnabacteria bacterium]